VPELGDSTRVRNLIPPPQQPGQLPARREQRRPSPQSPDAPASSPDDVADGRPHIDEYA
jgi:hypothetical protein